MSSNKNVKNVFSWWMGMDMNGGHKNDLWRLHCDVGGENPVMPSPPVSVEREGNCYLITTASGSIYKLLEETCQNPAKETLWLNEIKAAVSNGWERH